MIIPYQITGSKKIIAGISFYLRSLLFALSFILPELVDAYPPEFPLEELVGYLAIGMKGSQHAVDKTDAIQIDEFSLPKIIFSRSTAMLKQ